MIYISGGIPRRHHESAPAKGAETGIMDTANLKKLAASATLHCLAGCAIGEILGLIIGTHFGLSNLASTGLAFALSFVSGYALSTVPLVRSGVNFRRALRLVLAADTVSILTMEIVDNTMMWLIPGAMDAHYFDTFFWLSMTASLAVAFLAAWPVNFLLLRRGKGHALTHHYHHKHDSSNEGGHADEHAHHHHGH